MNNKYLSFIFINYDISKVIMEYNIYLKIQELHKSVQQNTNLSVFRIHGELYYTYELVTLVASWIWADPRTLSLRRESEVGNFRITSIFRNIRRSLSSSLNFVFSFVVCLFLSQPYENPLLIAICVVSWRGPKASTIQHVHFFILFIEFGDFFLQSCLCYLLLSN